MSSIPLTNGFKLMSEGEHLLKVVDVKDNMDFGKVNIKLKNAKGESITNRFTLKKASGDWHEGALNAFSFFVKTVMNDYTLKSIEPKEMIGHFVIGEVTYTTQTNKNDESKTITFANISEVHPTEDTFEEDKEKSPSENVGNTVSIDDLLASE